MLQLTVEYINKDNMAALRVLEDLDQVAAQSGDSSWMVKIKRVKGQVLFLLERNLESEEILINALKVAVRHNLSTERLYIEHTLGKVKLFNGEYDDALKFYFNVLELAKVIGGTDDRAVAFNSIGLVYYKLKDYRKGLIYFEKAFDAHQSFGQVPPFILTNLGLCYAHLGNLSSARRYVERAELVCGDSCLDKNKISIEYTSGVVSLKDMDHKGARMHFTKSYQLSKA